MDRAKALRLNPYQRHLKDRIGRGRDHWEMATASLGASYSDYIVKLFRAGAKHPVSSQFYTKEALEKALSNPIGKPLPAFINHNRWLAVCECGGAEVVDPQHKYMYCFSCFNMLNKGRPRHVKFPHRMKRIEAILLEREDPLTKNWMLTESIEDLEAENVAHGIPVPTKEK
jgi:hypothetical protein